MNSRFAFCGIATMIAANFASAGSYEAPATPYKAIVAAPTVAVLSGPGESHYVSSQLTVGDRVEVYRHEANGYVAVRPPESCVSWVRRSDLESAGPGVARVKRSDTPVRVAGAQGEGDAVHIRLEAGELVALATGGAATPPDGWVAIAPPAGEFRWVWLGDLEPLGVNGDEGQLATEPEDAWRSVESSALTHTEAAGETAQLADPEGGAAAEADAIVLVSDAQPRYGAAEIDQTAARKPQADQEPIDASFSQQVDALEVALSTIVAERPNLWRFEPLEAEAASLLTSAPTEADRQTVRAIAGRIDRFAAIAGRYRQMRDGGVAPATRPDPAATAAGSASPPTTLASTAETIGSNASGYDAVGRLRPVVSQRADAPKFALVDDRGKVVTFLTPSPDMNLQPMLGKRIGVRGAKGFLTEYQQPHLTANRINAIDTKLR
ncbi:hypothetical protein Mal64_11020 [Pseudobythopirellula maris]|uniref:SLA1 homology domain-containing protein n=1 Tax=Pseudobythopirellula maris TaxID=2527991 RepID=A0A5C5ZUN5_9BACT|nr:SH3 domain-containing protein [Pseudobythopirellula maris]TWT90707.1 hypothetical protein Mal64_11020 [Pseudobythopirellula maris]